MVDLQTIKNDPVIRQYMEMANQFVGCIGAIEHNIAHADLVASLSYDIIFSLGYPRREAEVAAIAGYLHDIGNLVSRYRHGTWGAIMVFEYLLDLGWTRGDSHHYGCYRQSRRTCRRLCG